MMTTQHYVLSAANFGSRTAEEESEHLKKYFVETEQWRKVFAGEVDIVFGAKGSGKSAIYSLLVSQKDQLRTGSRTIFIAAENPVGAPAFRDLKNNSLSLKEENFRGLWKLYFLSLAANYLRHHMQIDSIVDQKSEEVFKLLEENNLLAKNMTLLTRLKAVLGYIKQNLPVFEGSIVEPNTGLKISGKIVLNEPSIEESKLGYRSLDDLLNAVNERLKKSKIIVWLVLDRLDVAFSETDELEGIALRALFRSYLDMKALSQIKIKIFLRDDIWKKITDQGFREASHIEKVLTLGWSNASLLNLIIRRMVSNKDLCDYYKVDPKAILADVSLQSKLFYRVFPAQVDAGGSKSKTLDWMISRASDGTKRTAPRELIHLLLEAKNEQLKLYELGNSEPANEKLFEKSALRAALPAVSQVRYKQTLCAEYPSLKIYLDHLEREKTLQSASTLSKLWNKSEEEAKIIAEKMVEVGFFERRGSKELPTYWVPFLYREGLSMVQGTAAGIKEAAKADLL